MELTKREDGKQQNQIDPTNGLLNFDYNYDFFPNIKKLLVIGCVSPIWFTVAESAASGLRRLKNPFRTTMEEQQESDLNLMQLQRVQDTDIDQIVVSFIKKKPKILPARSILFV